MLKRLDQPSVIRWPAIPGCLAQQAKDEVL